MSFEDDINRFVAKLDHADKALLPAVAAEVHNSIQNGSALTGAPGQPVDTGNLKASYQLTFPDADHAEISTNAPYALSNEDGIARPGGGPYVQKSAVGGRHSVSKTIDGFPRLVEHAAQQLRGDA